MDIYNETLVKRKLTPNDKHKVRLIFTAMILLSIIFILIVPFWALSRGLAFVSTVSLIVFAVILYLLYRLLKGMQLEFEYIITNDAIDFDKIIAQKKRQRLISAEAKTVTEVGIYNKDKFNLSSFSFVVHAERNELSYDNFYMIFSHAKHGRTIVIFSPNQKMTENLKKVLLPSVAKTIPEIKQ